MSSSDKITAGQREKGCGMSTHESTMGVVCKTCRAVYFDGKWHELAGAERGAAPAPEIEELQAEIRRKDKFIQELYETAIVKRLDLLREKLIERAEKAEKLLAQRGSSPAPQIQQIARKHADMMEKGEHHFIFGAIEAALNELAASPPAPPQDTELREAYEALVAYELTVDTPTDADLTGPKNAAPPQPQEWIPVEEKLPELSRSWQDNGTEYKESDLVLLHDRRTGRRTGYLEGSGGWSAAGGDRLHNVTHWRPLPEPPVKSEPFGEAPAEK